MSTTGGFVGGILGAFTITVVEALARAFGIRIDLEAYLGGLLTGSYGAWTWLIGFVLHLLVGGLLGLFYAQVLPAISSRPRASVGGAFGLVHALVAGVLLLALQPSTHPAIPEALPVPGPFLAYLDGAASVVLFFLVHVIYGAVVGGVGARIRRIA